MAVPWTVRPPVTGTAFAHFFIIWWKNLFLLNLAGKAKFVIDTAFAHFLINEKICLFLFEFSVK